jgi:hypothetical protein
VFRVGPSGGAATVLFRVPPMVNGVGVGRQNQSLQPGAPPATQGIVANGLAFDEDGDLFVADTARGALWRVELSRKGEVRTPTGCDVTYTADSHGHVSEFFRNPVDAANLRNGGPLEFPTSPVLAGKRLCSTSSDGNRRDNSPNTAGEARPGSAVVGEVSCLDQRLKVSGLPLPVD